MDWLKRRAAVKTGSKRPPLIPAVPSQRLLKPGTILAREHEGELHRVMVLDEGFAWNGATYRSLSEVARAITGTNWSGPRFFGLRDNPGRLPPSPTEMEQAVKIESAKSVRCAIYTRVSSDQRLEQDFNSLDNQREAAEAYIKSQAHEGWRPLPGAYEDGGFSGGILERPALQRLLADIRARLIDVVVVYKVDRLTRSLADFAKLIELFEQHAASFVSVTQAFDTTTSMGRLTLNVLLSFAQFEREVTAERIRDKIAASKRKGMRMGGAMAQCGAGSRSPRDRWLICSSQKLRMLLTHRKLLQSKAIAVDNDLRGTLRNFGLKVGIVGAAKFEVRIRELVEGFPDLAVMRWNKPANAVQQDLVSAAMNRAGEEASEVLDVFIGALGMPRSLGAVGIGSESFDVIAAQAMNTPWVPRNPRRIDGPAQVREILELAV